jgi:1-acyl-sn-glycerol-3-phosphate acyltransferase
MEDRNATDDARDIYPRVTWLHRIVFLVLSVVLRRKLKKHLSAISGIRNVPATGPMVVVANHESYFDTFAICVLLNELFGRRVWVPTKVKAFKGPIRRLLHEAWGAIAIDPANPTEAYRKIGALLERGECVLVFPEGKRSEGAGLLPFHYGGFNMSAKFGAPVVPITLHGTARVLPKGRLSFVRGTKASVEIGAPMDPRAYAVAGDAGEAAVSARMRDAAREWISGRPPRPRATSRPTRAGWPA